MPSGCARPGPTPCFHEIEPVGGMSGAPLVLWDGQDCVAVGIRNYGHVTGNIASRITKQVFYNLERWKWF